MDNLQELISLEIEATRTKRNRMLFVVANRVSKEKLHRAIHQMAIPILNVNLLLSEQLRQLPPDKRPFEVGRILRSLIASNSNDVVFLDRIEYLFDTELRQNPIRLFENLSGNKTLIIHWPGMIERGTLTYATSEHPEYYSSDTSYLSYVIEI
ncbi:BREX-3 system P-loop-containing protein BrxF [Paenibacillus sp. D51F]